MNTSFRHRSRAFRLGAGWCALVLYVGAASRSGLVVAALLGSFDPDHRALVQTDMDSTRLILHHEQKCATHHHGLVARALTVFAEPVSAGQLDHVLQFRSANSFSRQTQFIAPLPAQLEQPVVAVIEPPEWSSREESLSSLPTHSPPRASGQLLCLRSTLLLI